MIKNYFFLALIFSSTLIACNKDDDDNTTTPPIDEADIQGSVNLYDESINEVSPSGMTVYIEGLASSAFDITDDEGDFTLESVPFGTYVLIYEKENYGTYKAYQLSHDPDEGSTIIQQTPSLGQISTTQITGANVSYAGDSVTFYLNLVPQANNSNQRYIRYFLSSSDSVSSTNYEEFSPGIIARIEPFHVSLTQSELQTMGFQSGQTVYFIAYGESFWSNQYEDVELGFSVFPNLNSSTVSPISFVVP